MNTHTNLPATLRSLPEIVAEFDAKFETINETIEAFKAAEDRVEMQSCISGTYVGGAFSGGKSYLHRSNVEKNLLKSAWRHVYTGLNLDMIASATDRKRFEMSFEDPAPFTIDNIRATFGGYVKDPRFHILKGLAECFVDLDPAYKSHSKVKVGVKGLPKRVIIESCGSYGAWGYERLRDMLNALRVYQGKPHLDHNEYDDFLSMADKTADDLEEWNDWQQYRSGAKVQHNGKAYKATGYMKIGEFQIGTGSQGYHWREINTGEEGLTLKRYMNGNAHVIFSPAMLLTINRALAEFYGEILPDVEPDKDDLSPRPSTAVSKDLQYFPTPVKVIHAALSNVSISVGDRVLEPSCGDGRIMDELIKVQPKINLIGIEVNIARAEQARNKGHNIFLRNFLETAATPLYHLIVMNPPFYGMHWRKHLDHARKFLKPRDVNGRSQGTLVCILPATAYYDGHLDDIKGRWTDLPVASFNESGTNVPTGYFTCWGEE